ncbi:MAG TPA: ABC transporter permease [Candidatus Saccharimonadales bacterium]|nr:ABC transporter permease [Candidatus Saccharimonadales bacterium]
MRAFATLRIALRALRRNKMRTILTMLGMIIGVGAVIASVSITNGAKQQVEEQIASLGENMLLVFPGSFSSSGARLGWGNWHSLTLDDALAIQTQLQGVTGVSPENRTRTQVIAGNQNWNTSVQGESPEYLQIRQWALAKGEMFDAQAVRQAAKVCVIGNTVVEQLFPDSDPLGKLINISGVPCQIIGLLQAKGLSPMGQDQDDVVIVPYTTMQKRIDREDWVDTILVQAVSSAAMPIVQQEITSLLDQRHHIKAGGNTDFIVRSQEDIANAFTATARVMSVLLAGIAAVSLVVGGIGIMNIMLVSVTERTREIGIRMAVGARGGDILVQFLIEAVTLSLIGGGIGIASGMGISLFVSSLTHWPTLTPAVWIVIASFSSGLIGIFSGFYPAWKASKLDPIDALRYE